MALTGRTTRRRWNCSIPYASCVYLPMFTVVNNSVQNMKEAGLRIYGRIAIPFFLVALLASGGCASQSPWIHIAADEKVYSMLDIPLRKLQEETDDYIGIVFEDQFKFYRIYHDKEDADPALRGQVILGETHFTARPVKQYLYAIQIEITPRQEEWIREHGIERQDAIRARIRFKGIAPGSALTFELLEIIEAPGYKKR